jgi:hypothetical protein
MLAIAAVGKDHPDTDAQVDGRSGFAERERDPLAEIAASAGDDGDPPFKRARVGFRNSANPLWLGGFETRAFGSPSESGEDRN